MPQQLKPSRIRHDSVLLTYYGSIMIVVLPTGRIKSAMEKNVHNMLGHVLSTAKSAACGNSGITKVGE